MLKKLINSLHPYWQPGTIAQCSAGGGLVLVKNRLIPYHRTDLLPGCIVYTVCKVWRHRITGKISTHEYEKI